MFKPPIRSRITSSGTPPAIPAQKKDTAQSSKRTSPPGQPGSKRKTSEEIMDTVNGLIQEARLTKQRTDGNQRFLGGKNKINLQKNTVSKTGAPSATARGTRIAVHNPTNKRAASNATTVQTASKPFPASTGKNVTNRVKSPVTPVGQRARKTYSPRCGASVSISTSSMGQAAEATTSEEAFDKDAMEPPADSSGSASEEEFLNRSSPSGLLDLDLSTSEEDSDESSDDELLRSPRSPPKTKTWPEQLLLGPSSPEWKFRPPAAGGRFNELGPEELSKIFQGLKLDERPNQMRLNKREPDKTMTSRSSAKRTGNPKAAAERNVQLKQFYSQQLDEMKEKAMASLKQFSSAADDLNALEDGERKKGLSRIPHRNNDDRHDPAGLALAQRQPPASIKPSKNPNQSLKNFCRGDGMFGKGGRVRLEYERKAPTGQPGRAFRGPAP